MGKACGCTRPIPILLCSCGARPGDPGVVGVESEHAVLGLAPDLPQQQRRVGAVGAVVVRPELVHQIALACVLPQLVIDAQRELKVLPGGGCKHRQWVGGDCILRQHTAACAMRGQRSRHTVDNGHRYTDHDTSVPFCVTKSDYLAARPQSADISVQSPWARVHSGLQTGAHYTVQASRRQEAHQAVPENDAPTAGQGALVRPEVVRPELHRVFPLPRHHERHDTGHQGREVAGPREEGQVQVGTSCMGGWGQRGGGGIVCVIRASSKGQG
jgi:hypothetical protein